jgi:hypothetical protein
MNYFCCDERRRAAVLAHPTLNGIDFLEVLDDPANPSLEKQKLLQVHFLKSLAPGQLSKDNFRIDGGERIRNIAVVRVSQPAGSPPSSPPGASQQVVLVEGSSEGDFSTYTLSLVRDSQHTDPPDGFDPMLSSVDFSFKIACQSDFDCKPARVCPPGVATALEISYLAKDYQSLQRLMFDRMALLNQQWTERNPADVGVTLVELLAFVGDYLSYKQDAIATEAYLGTARKRASVRRHVRLVDYAMHDGRNSRVWVQILVSAGAASLSLHKGSGANTTKLLTRVEGIPTIIKQGSDVFDKALASGPQVFELMQDNITLFREHNQIRFYTWGDRECCLPKGSTSATLGGALPNLNAGDILIFCEVKGPETGRPEDADPSHRWAVRLTGVVPGSDPAGGRFQDPPNNSPIPVTKIQWDRADALPVAVCISARSGTEFFDNISVALGNIVLADNGMTFTDEPQTGSINTDTLATSLDPDKVPDPNPVLTELLPALTSRCEGRQSKTALPRYRPALKRTFLTQSPPFDPENPPATASATINWSPGDPAQRPVPVISLLDPATGQHWVARNDLLASKPEDLHFVVEVETDGTPYIRFGDGVLGAHPAPDARLLATYRIGNATPGNIGSDRLGHIVTGDPIILNNAAVTGIRNPLAATGGVDQEDIESVRQNAPSAFRSQARAVTDADYADAATRCSVGIQRAAATFRWTGSWRTVFVTPDLTGGVGVDAKTRSDLLNCLERVRMAGQDLEVDSPTFVSLDVEMTVCVKRDYFASDVKTALLRVLSNSVLPDGRLGVFHPDKFTFGQTVFLSPVYAAVQGVAGVESVTITAFQPLGVPARDAVATGQLDLGRLEIARMDNDPDFPERGKLTLTMLGGR